jgi:hypothetical protein
MYYTADLRQKYAFGGIIQRGTWTQRLRSSLAMSVLLFFIEGLGIGEPERFNP